MSYPERLHALDAVRAFALLMGLVLHGAFSFIPGMIPGIWAFVDNSPSTTLSVVVFVTHIFRMSLFFFIAGLFARMVFMRKGADAFWLDRSVRILLPLTFGWMLMSRVIPKVWGWGVATYFDGNVPAFPAPPGGAAQAPWHAITWTHLWFLYMLLVLYVLVLGARAIVTRLDKQDMLGRACEGALAWLLRSGLACLVLGLPLFVALLNQPSWISFFGIPTPESSFLPNLPAVVGFGTAFVVGWLLHRQLGLLDLLARRWVLHVAVALLGTGVCLYLNGLVPAWRSAQAGMATTLYALSYCCALWAWIFGITGMAVRFLNRESKLLRYLADSSYWLYLMHLPLMAALQVLVGRWPLHWAVKFPLVLGASLFILLLSYHLLVRNTLIGQILNGRRYGRARESGDARSQQFNTPAQGIQ